MFGMFGVGFWELILIGIILAVIVGIPLVVVITVLLALPRGRDDRGR